MLDKVIEIYEKGFMNESLRLSIIGTYAASLNIYMIGDPVWIQLFGPPGKGKSHILKSFEGHRMVCNIDNITEKSFASDFQGAGGKDYSLLLEAMGKIVVMKDWTTIVTNRKDKRDAILGQLRSIYDGEYSNKTGRSSKKSFKSRFVLIVGLTPDCAKLLEETVGLGERFLRLDIEPKDATWEEEIEKMDKIGGSLGQDKTLTEELKKITYSYLDSMDKKAGQFEWPKLLPEELRIIKSLAIFSAKLRSGGQEDPSRFFGQLYRLGQCVGLIAKDNKNEEGIGRMALQVLRKTSIDSVDTWTADMLRMLFWREEGNVIGEGMLLEDLQDMTNKRLRIWSRESGKSRINRIVKKLVTMEWLEAVKSGVGFRYRLTDSFRRIIREVEG